MKLILNLVVFSFLLINSAALIFAAPGQCAGPDDEGNCVNGRICVKSCLPDPDIPCTYSPSGPACGAGVGSSVVGKVFPPMAILNINTQAGGVDTIGLLYFANRVILLITIIAGIIVMFNFIKAGWMYITAGDNTKVAGEVKDVLTFSVIGLVIIVVSYTIAGLIGLLFFGDAGFILNPELYKATDIQ